MAIKQIDKSNELAQELLSVSGGSLEQAISKLRTAYSLQRSNNAKRLPKRTEVIVRVSNVVRQYKVGSTKVQALNNASVEIFKGEFVAITGASGSGKSTLLQIIGGLDKPNAGEVEVTGQKLASLSDAKLSRFRNKTIGFVFQFFYLQPFLNLQTNVEVPAMFARAKRDERATRSAELSAIVGLDDRIKHLPRELSGGQMQRAAIARALQNKPAILLADEPTGNLDRANAHAIFELFQKVRDEQGTTVVVVTHDNELAHMADRIITMSDGAVQ